MSNFETLKAQGQAKINALIKKEENDIKTEYQIYKFTLFAVMVVLIAVGVYLTFKILASVGHFEGILGMIEIAAIIAGVPYAVYSFVGIFVNKIFCDDVEFIIHTYDY